MIDAVRTGRWITRQRLCVYPAIIILITFWMAVFVTMSSDGLNHVSGKPLGTDFSNVYAAGTYAREGQAALAFDPVTQYRREQEIFGEKTPFFGWHYPPFFLFLAVALATMPYAVALVVWQASTLPLYLAAVRLILPRPLARAWVLLPAAGFPAVMVNLAHGHNGFLTAALLGCALVVLDRRPIVAGILIGLLAYKPQFGLLIPLVLLATGRWHALMAAGATVLALVAASTLVFGTGIWSAFLASTEFTRTVVLEDGNTGWHKIQSVFSWVRMWGGSVSAAYAVQGATALGLAIALVRLWRSASAFELKAGALMVGAILATPYSLDYDMMVLGPALAFAVAHGLRAGFRNWEKSFLVLVWVSPLIARGTASLTGIPLGVLCMTGLFVMMVSRGLSESRTVRSSSTDGEPQNPVPLATGS